MSTIVSSSKSYSPIDSVISDGLLHEFLFDGNLSDSCNNIVTIDPDNKGFTGAGLTYGVESPIGNYVFEPLSAANTAIFAFTSSYTFGTNTPFSTSCWVKMPTTNKKDVSQVIYINQYDNNVFKVFQSYYSKGVNGLMTTPNTYMFGFMNGSYTYTLMPYKAGMDFGWHHFVMTYNGSNVAKTYIDGELLYTGTATQSGTSGSKICLFGENYSPSHGSIYVSLLRIFSKALTDAEVTLLYNEVM